MIQEQVQATASQAHYSPEEAGEILRIAAHLQDNTITAEQLRAIAREAGVSDENLERAIQQYEQSRQAEAQISSRQLPDASAGSKFAVLQLL
jgi:protein-disulfide isomerase-like protein with CxxC motif